MELENTVVPSWLVLVMVARSLWTATNIHTSDLELVGILDNDEKKKGQKLGKIPVLGSYNELPELAKRYRVEKVIVAIPSLDPSEYERILQMCKPA